MSSLWIVGFFHWLRVLGFSFVSSVANDMHDLVITGAQIVQRCEPLSQSFSVLVPRLEHLTA